MKFAFCSVTGSSVIVEAASEAAARTEAMKKLWGDTQFRLSIVQPTGGYLELPYKGLGLDLVSVSPT
jgi:hypothetical protein